MRLVVLGGSGASTPELLDAIAAWPGGDGRRPNLEVVLQGRSTEKLHVVAQASRARIVGISGVTVVAEVDLDAALDGADIVLVQTRIGGLEARVFDETFPHAEGLPGEETMGPGGFANALRTVPSLIPVWHRIEERAPTATVLNLTNPAGIVSHVARARTSLRVVSVCESPATMCASIAATIGRDEAAVRRGYVGLNHAGFWAGSRDEARAAVAASAGITVDDVEGFGALPSPYVRYYLRPREQLAAQRAAAEPRGAVLSRLESRLLVQYDGRDQGERRGAAWYGEGVVPAIDAITHGAAQPLILGLANNGRAPWAPNDATVEGPTLVRGGKPEPLPPVALPPAAASLLERHAAYESLTAALFAPSSPTMPSPKALETALAANPMVPDRATAARLVERIAAATA